MALHSGVIRHSWRFGCLDRFLHINLSAWRRRRAVVLLVCAWFLGLVTGLLLSLSASDILFPTMRAAVASCVSISGLLSTILLPLLFSAFAVYSSNFWLLIPIAFSKAFLFTFLGTGILAAFGSAGWLIHILLIFSGTAMPPVLWWYWLSALSGTPTTPFHSIAALPAACLIGSLDYCVISPFLANLIS